MLITGADALLESPYYFPVLEVLHILGFALTVGTIALVDFRLLGWGLPQQTAAGLTKSLAPWTLVGLVSLLMTGPMLFVVDPDMYYLNFSFQLKMVLLAAAVIFHYTAHRKTASAGGSPARMIKVGRAAATKIGRMRAVSGLRKAVREACESLTSVKEIAPEQFLSLSCRPPMSNGPVAESTPFATEYTKVLFVSEAVYCGRFCAAYPGTRRLRMYTRRQFGKLAVAAAGSLALPAFRQNALGQGSTLETVIKGVRFGIETFSFHDLPPAGDPKLIPTLIDDMRFVGVRECEIMSGHVEPMGSYATGWWVATRRAAGYNEMREKARQWRMTVPMDYYASIRKQFDDAGMRMYYYNVNFNETFTDEERDRTFEAAKVLGVEGFSSSTVISEAKRLVPFVDRHKMFVAMHNHNNLVDPDQFATPRSFEQALEMSPWFKATLDVGHFVAGNNDPVDFIEKHHDRITNVHIRDRRRDNGRGTPLGQGSAPIREVLRLIRDKKYNIRCYLEYEYGSFRSSRDETKRMFDFCQEALA